MSDTRYTLTETFCIIGALDDAIIFFEKFVALRNIYRRVPAGARLCRLPDTLQNCYRREVHIYRGERGYEQPMEIAIREDTKDAAGRVIYEYSTDYEL